MPAAAAHAAQEVLTGGWTQQQDQHGRTFYYNTSSGHSRWEPPLLDQGTLVSSGAAADSTGAEVAAHWAAHVDASAVLPLDVHREDFADNDSFMSIALGSPRSLRHHGHDRRQGREVYVQNTRHPSKFRAVAPERARRIYGTASVLDGGGGGSAGAKGVQGKRGQEQDFAQQVCTNIAAIQAAVLDVDAAQLASSADPVDKDIFEILVQAELWRLRAAPIFLLFQGMLASLCLVAGWLALSTKQEGQLPESVTTLEPGLTGLTLALGEASIVGALLTIWSAHDTAAASAARGAVDQAGDEAERRRLAWAEATKAGTSAFASAVVVACCLLSTRSTTVMVEAVPTKDAKGAAQQGPFDAAPGLLFALRAGFGVLAAGPALMNLQRLMVPKLPMAGVQTASRQRPIQRATAASEFGLPALKSVVASVVDADSAAGKEADGQLGRWSNPVQIT